MINIPTTAQLYSDIKDDLEAAYGENISPFGKVFIRAVAGVQAGKIKLYYLALGKLQKNIFVDTADTEASGGTLERFGRIKLGRNPFPARAGQYAIQVTGTVGATINASTTFKSNDDSLSPGKLYVLDSTYTLVSTTDYITVRALEPGTDSQLETGDALTTTAPIANVNKLASVLSQAIQPLASEDIEDYRQKAIDAYQLEPQGGAGTDYRLWASDVQGVQQTYPYAKSGSANEINLFIEATIEDSTDGKGTPSSQLLLDVEDAVELDPDTTKPLNERGRRPLGVFQVHYLAVTIKEIDIEISGFVGITTPIQNSIYAAVKAALDEIRPFVASADILENKNDIFDLNRIISIILNTRPGSTFGSIDLLVDNVSLSTYTFINGNIPHLRNITYV
jgi:hypothetical protein